MVARVPAVLSSCELGSTLAYVSTHKLPDCLDCPQAYSPRPLVQESQPNLQPVAEPLLAAFTMRRQAIQQLLRRAGALESAVLPAVSVPAPSSRFLRPLAVCLPPVEDSAATHLRLYALHLQLAQRSLPSAVAAAVAAPAAAAGLHGLALREPLTPSLPAQHGRCWMSRGSR